MSENLGSKVNLTTMEKVQRCLYCEGHIERCPEYHQTNGYKICMWKQTINTDRKKYFDGRRDLTFDEVRQIIENQY